ncbi:MAG: RNA methyltransferase [Spirochaetaceae bacterium]|jgi:RsmE family RNA methyltransferase|nr:RNA methyltransferase [Spirochaetaceae bacterium]
MNIILFEEHELSETGTVFLDRQDKRNLHLRKILHKGVGDTFEAGLLGQGRGQGCIERLEADCSLSCSVCFDAPPPPKIPVRLAVGFVRPLQLRRILKDMATMGVQAIDLIGTDLGEQSYRDTSLLRTGAAQAALIEGAVQAYDTVLPSLAVYHSVDTWLLHCGHESTLIVADTVSPSTLLSAQLTLKAPFTLAIGSERGWSSRERHSFEAAGFMRLSLGERILRTETACVAAVTLLTALQ